jgi:RHS repeat-associated protein
VELSYTKNGQVAKVKRGSAVVNYQYDEVGNLLSITDPNGKRVEMSYDAANRMQGISRDNGPSLEFAFNDENRISAQTLLDSGGGILKTVSYFYDAQARLNERREEGLSGAGANRQLHSYDEQGQLAELRDNDRSIAEFSRSGLGQLMQISQPGDINTVLHKSIDGEVVGVTDANGNSTIRQLDDYGRTVILHSLDVGISYFKHDRAGNLVARHNASSDKFEREYDAANRLRKHSDKEGVREYSYDTNSGKLASVESSTSSDYFQYDKLARLSDHTRSIDGFTFSTTYEYNDYDQLVRKVLPDGRVLQYQYYLAGAQKGELREVTTDALWGFGERALLKQLDDNRWDGLSSINYGNGLSTTYRYNNGGNIESISTADTFSFNYDYDKRGNIVGIKSDGANSQFSYDEHNRLTGATVGEAQYGYRYDKVGNRVQADTNGESQSLSYGKFASGNRVQNIGTEPVSYNAQGSPLKMPSADGLRRYEYSAQQRPLKLFVDGLLRAEYAYNGFGERIKKTTYKRDGKGTTSETRYYLYDGRELSAEVSGDGEVKATYIYHQGRPAVKIEGSDIYYLHTDHLGTPRLVTNENKKVVWKASYSPFGKANIEIQEISLNLRFPGQYEDQESGTHYNYFRDYDPQLGRYLSSDPIGLRAGINTYAYSHSNPIMGSDSLGLFTRPSNQQESDELIQRLSSFNDQQISDYVNSELSSFDDRQHFYRWAHDQLTTKPGATRTNWFLAASQVNEFDSLGGVGFGWGGLDPFSSETEDFLVTAGLSLANHNIGTFFTMIGGGSVFNLCFLDQESQDLELVTYEQEELARITTDYFTNNPTLDQNEIMTDINDVFNHIGFGGFTGQIFGDGDTQRVIDKHFHDKNPPDQFDINNIEHRIILGQELVRINAGTFEP